jgi:U3 small nucleolar RNA-associated protein 10
LTPKEAAGIDVEDVFKAGLTGLSTLQQHDDRFAEFVDSLFHSSSVRLQRELKSAEENAAIDKKIERLLALLTLYASEKATHCVLEYLIRRYRIHDMNADSLIRMVIAVHDTKVLDSISIISMYVQLTFHLFSLLLSSLHRYLLVQFNYAHSPGAFGAS